MTLHGDNGAPGARAHTQAWGRTGGVPADAEESLCSLMAVQVDETHAVAAPSARTGKRIIFFSVTHTFHSLHV